MASTTATAPGSNALESIPESRVGLALAGDRVRSVSPYDDERLVAGLVRDALLQAIEQVLGPQTVFSVRFQPRFASRWDIGSRKLIGLRSGANS